MNVQLLPRTPPNRTLELPVTATGIKSTPYSEGMASCSSHLNDSRREVLANLPVNDVLKTANAQALAMLTTFTRRIMPLNSKENPKDVFGRILDKVSSVWEVTIAGPSTLKQTRRGRATKQSRNNLANDAKARVEKVEKMKKAHNAFLKASSERETYQPFMAMTNTGLDLLKNVEVEGTIPRNSEYDILLHHNDPSLLYYQYNNEIHRRKPDNIFVTLDTARMLHKVPTASWTDVVTKYAGLSPTNAGKSHPRLDWGDALCSVEHKREAGKISKQSLSKLKEESLLPLKDLNCFFPTRSSKKRSIDTISKADEDRSGSKRRKTNQGGTAKTAPTHTIDESPLGVQVQDRLHQDVINWENSVAIQSAEYGLGRLCCSYDMLHAFTLIVVEGVLHISWYDHEGIITTNGFSLAGYIHYYLALLFIFQRFDRSAWGWCGDDNLRSNRRSDGIKESIVSIDDKEFEFDPTKDENVLRKPFAIGGRATSAYSCSGVGEQEANYVIKFNWKEESRLSEREIFEEIQKRVQSEQEVNFTNKVFREFRKFAGEVKDENDGLLSYLPEVVAGAETDISTKTIREALGLESHPRHLVVIVFVKLDGMVRHLGRQEYWQAFWDCMRCHKRLWKLGICHRDISNGNMMYCRRNGHLFGILIDFDLASIAGVPSHNQHRTGTRPFMAYDLFDLQAPHEHLYRHDAESFFWVAVYDSASRGSSVHEWGNLNDDRLSGAKAGYLMGISVTLMEDKLEDPRPLRHWLDKTRRFFAICICQPSQIKESDVDKLYNTLRGFREDGGAELSGYIETRRAKYHAKSTQ